ncbi:MAG TPA: DUF5985 family protein [Sporichthyaceae bacterium]|jgi:hypothetical protein|nr:DUF5985 family protein [Sporichthyaceae bacterium]
MAAFVYSLCAVSSILCAVLLMRSWSRERVRLLMWVGLGFVGLAADNVVLLADEVVAVHSDLHLLREFTGLTAVCTLLFGLIWESR